ncbi:Glucooligosaccharide oxidase [Xylariaceae sp. AK1471]|nr:Glucooligosaccharide oxidase [Xylariaceae sp. AK1471]
MRSASAVLGACLYSAVVTALPADTHTFFTNSSNAWNAKTTIEFPNSATFENATARWNNNDVPKFAIAITPATEADVVRALIIARSINLPLLATGGRHAVSKTLGEVDEGIEIDLSALNSVSVDAKAGTLTVGGGTRFKQIYDPVYDAGYIMPVGSCACPGMVGATIGAGVGRYQGLFGLIIDSLVSVRLVTAEGKLIEVSESSHPDLLWAIRGAGANFGIITSATYKLHPQTNGGQVVNADFVFPASSNASYFDMIQSLQEGMPAELSTISIMEYNATSAEAQLVVNWVYIGPEDEGNKYISPLLSLNPIKSSITIVPYNKLIDVAIGGLGVSICGQTRINGYGANYRNLDSATFQKVFQRMSNFYAEYPDGHGSSIEMEVFAPQAVEAVAVDATAYPWRDSKGYVLISFGFNSTETEAAGEAVAQAVRSDYAETGGYDGLAVYVSYGHGDETLEEVFGSNLPRLTKLKKRYDPDNVFRYYHALPTSS